MTRELVHATSLVALAIAACTRPDPLTTDVPLQQVVEALTRQNPNPVSVSPSGQLVLMKSMHAADFELEVVRRRDDVVVTRHRARDTQLAPTWRFDDGAIAFLADHDGDQRHRLFVLDVASGEVRGIEGAPATQATALRWEPRGTRVAYLVAERGRRDRKLVVVDTGSVSPPAIVVDGISDRSGFVWSPDGALLASASHALPATLLIGDSRGGTARRLRVADDGEIRSIAWSDDGDRLLLTLRRSGDEHFGLVEVSLSDGAVLREVRAAGDISGPLYLPLDGLAFHVNEDGEVGVFVCEGSCGERRRMGPADGTSVITGFSRDRTTAWILHTGRTTPPALFSVELVSAAMVSLYAKRSEADRAIAAERIDVESVDRLRVPVYLWRARKLEGAPSAALIRVHGGPAAQAMRNWDPAIQLLAQQGVHVLSVNYRGSTGYGARFEQPHARGDGKREHDVIAAVDFAERELGVPRERIVLLGHSYGALLVADVARRDPRPPGAIVLVSYVGPSAAKHVASETRVLVFQGENDIAMSPSQARKRLAARFGGDVFEPARGLFVELQREGHTFHRVESWARVYATVLALLQRGRG